MATFVGFDLKTKYLIFIFIIMVSIPFIAVDGYLSVPPTGSFKMINMTGGNVTAQFTNSFVEFKNGSGISITPNYSLNEITFTASGNGGVNNTISSIGTQQSIVSGQVLINHQLKGIACGGDLICSSNATDVTISFTELGGSSTLDDLTDVIITTPAYLSTLFYNGVEWIDKIFSINSVTCGAGQFVNIINNQTGTTSCGGTAREETVALWGLDRPWTNIGATYVDVYATANSNGEGIRIDTNGKTTVTLNIMWTKAGAGTQKCQIVDIASATNVLILDADTVSGENTNATQNIPAGLVDTIHTYKPQCRSSTAGDDPVWLSGQVLLR